MARTYGEVLEVSFPDVFRLASGPDTAFVDIGSGHGTITFDAVRKYGCCFALGIEKYREPAAICTDRLTQMPCEVREKLRFILEDVNDTDLLDELSGLTYKRLLLFCNNLAFSQGTVNRLARKVGQLMRDMKGKEVIVVSTVPLTLLNSHFSESVQLRMSWTQDLHESCVYRSHSPVL